MYSILFVCSGNTCRSPMAEALLRAQIPEGMRPDVDVRSAGTMACPGMPATPNTVRALESRGVDLGSHRSRRISREMIHGADLILTMEEDHRRQVLALVPDAADKTQVLSEFESEQPRGERLGIHDPIGGSSEIYEETCRRIEEHLARILPVILDRVGAE